MLIAKSGFYLPVLVLSDATPSADSKTLPRISHNSRGCQGLGKNIILGKLGIALGVFVVEFVEGN